MTVHTLGMFSQDAGFPYHLEMRRYPQEEPVHKNADFAMLLFCFSGAAVLRLNGRDYPLGKGDVMILRPQAEAGVLSPQDFQCCCLRFRPGSLLEKCPDLSDFPFFRTLFLPAGEDQEPIQMQAMDFSCAEYGLSRALAEIHEKKEGYQSALWAHLIHTVFLLCRLYQQPKARPSRGEDPLPQVLSWMKTHLTEEIPLEKLSDIARVSPRHLDRLFMSRYQTTPKAYLVKLRMEKARALLQHTKKSVTDIAFECGYTDSNYFARVFRKNTGFSPQQFRKALVDSSPK